MVYRVEPLAHDFTALVLDISDSNAEFERIDSAEDFSANSLVFVSDAKAFMQRASTLKTLPAAIAGDSETTQLFKAELLDTEPLAHKVTQTCLITVSDVRLAQALIKQALSDYNHSDSYWGERHPSAVVHPSAKLHPSVRVGPNSIIGADVEIGEGSHIRSNCVIEHSVRIGKHCVIHNLVNLGYLTSLGDRVIIRPGAIIGNEGFGFAQDEDRRYHRTPHTGYVEIEDDVQIGSNCNIDRGTYGATRIARGVKIDALCHIAHNVNIEEDALFVAQSGVAGSTKIGKRVIASGQTGILDHKTIADDAVLVHRCAVTKDIPESGMWAGNPPKPFKEYIDDLRTPKKVARLQQDLAELKKHSA